jgi:hydroxypyruvate reductase
MPAPVTAAAAMNKPRLLQHGRLLPALEAQLAEHFDLHGLWREADPKAFLARHGAEFVGLATSARFGADAALIDALPALKVISSFGVGTDAIDVARAQARGSGKRLGILGLGRIGQVVARRASGFDMEVRYHNRKPNPAVPYVYEADLKALAAWADFLVVVSAGGAETRHLVSAEVLAALGPAGFLINVARGSVIDEEALVHALETGAIAGAGLDVYADEPRIPQRLLTFDNVVLLPHLASATHETRKAMGDMVLDNLLAFFRSGQVTVGVPAA